MINSIILSPEIQQAKSELRESLKLVLSEKSQADHDAASVTACALLTSAPEFAAASCVMIFLSMPGEIDTSSIALRCWQEGKTVVVPKIISWKDARMLPVEINSLSTSDLRAGVGGIREPIAGNPMPPAMIDMAIVPGLGFSLKGDRIGRGKGFYDRFLASGSFLGVSAGLCFESQCIDAVPVEPHDVPVAMIVTERGIRRFKSNCLSR